MKKKSLLMLLLVLAMAILLPACSFIGGIGDNQVTEEEEDDDKDKDRDDEEDDEDDEDDEDKKSKKSKKNKKKRNKKKKDKKKKDKEESESTEESTEETTAEDITSNKNLLGSWSLTECGKDGLTLSMEENNAFGINSNLYVKDDHTGTITLSDNTFDFVYDVDGENIKIGVIAYSIDATLKDGKISIPDLQGMSMVYGKDEDGSNYSNSSDNSKIKSEWEEELKGTAWHSRVLTDGGQEDDVIEGVPVSEALYVTFHEDYTADVKYLGQDYSGVTWKFEESGSVHHPFFLKVYIEGVDFELVPIYRGDSIMLIGVEKGGATIHQFSMLQDR